MLQLSLEIMASGVFLGASYVSCSHYRGALRRVALFHRGLSFFCRNFPEITHLPFRGRTFSLLLDQATDAMGSELLLRQGISHNRTIFLLSDDEATISCSKFSSAAGLVFDICWTRSTLVPMS